MCVSTARLIEWMIVYYPVGVALGLFMAVGEAACCGVQPPAHERGMQKQHPCRRPRDLLFARVVGT